MYALLAICLSLCPQNKLIDENVSTQLKEKYNDKMTKMQRFDDEAYAAYDELFSYACPKFITPSPPVLDQPLTNYNQVMFLVDNHNDDLFLFSFYRQILPCNPTCFSHHKIVVKKKQLFGSWKSIFRSHTILGLGFSCPIQQ